jgi:hypothetical protein
MFSEMAAVVRNSDGGALCVHETSFRIIDNR